MGKSKGRSAWIVSLLTALVVFIMSFAVAEGISARGFYGRVTLDVNPSVELIFDNGIVSEVIAYNDEGQLILRNISPVGSTAENTLHAILQEMSEGGFLSDEGGRPYLLITANGNGLNEDFVKDLRDIAKDYIEELGKDADVEIISLHDDIFSQAVELGLSAGRYVMMQHIAQTQGITMEDAIAQYGSTHVKKLMDSFEGLEDAVKGEEPGDEEDEDYEFLVDEDDDDIDEDLNEDSEDFDDKDDDDIDDGDKDDDDIDDDEEKSEEQLLIEAQLREAEKKQREEERRLEEEKREAEKKQREEERRLEEEKREAEKKQREEERRLEEENDDKDDDDNDDDDKDDDE